MLYMTLKSYINKKEVCKKIIEKKTKIFYFYGSVCVGDGGFSVFGGSIVVGVEEIDFSVK